ncbi:hypothetical protein FNV43_RR07185 [Rhamnella rubrinervis]|uniref:Uncharacterized protein n=1 Tax=Rhamnella rubrinervis TaxID=2594499 RepID=A0A8K0HEC3_9ROSA|nr:hypothetical protein FNV43_RR07185 [Rhamnella rubrinervis]
MEGLIPMVFKAIKKNRTRRQYRCLSSSSSAAAAQIGYNISDFYVDSSSATSTSSVNHHHHHVFMSTSSTTATETIGGFAGSGHRRYKSVGGGGGHEDFGFGFSSKPNHPNHHHQDVSATPSSTPKQLLVRFTSLRMFSCVSAA